MIAKIYKKMHIRDHPFSSIVPICYQMCLNVVFSGLFNIKKKTIGLGNLKQNRLSHKKIF